MTDTTPTSSQPGSAIPVDDPNRTLTVADPDDTQVRHVSVVGDTYTMLVPGAQTAGRYCLIDMLVPDGSGPPPHRHDFEEMFSLLEGELEFTFRGKTQTVKAPATVNIPANAPHQFVNKSGSTVHMLCMCTPAGQEEFFMAVGVPVASRSGPPPTIPKEEMAAKGKLAQALSPKYRTELLTHA
jgi:quercetin dioxygenase-like cupin family protein